MPYIKAGTGVEVGQNFARLKVDTPVELALDEHAKPHCVIGYIAGDPTHQLGFMRSERVRIHTRRDFIVE